MWGVIIVVVLVVGFWTDMATCCRRAPTTAEVVQDEMKLAAGNGARIDMPNQRPEESMSVKSTTIKTQVSELTLPPPLSPQTIPPATNPIVLSSIPQPASLANQNQDTNQPENSNQAKTTVIHMSRLAPQFDNQPQGGIAASVDNPNFKTLSHINENLKQNQKQTLQMQQQAMQQQQTQQLPQTKGKRKPVTAKQPTSAKKPTSAKQPTSAKATLKKQKRGRHKGKHITKYDSTGSNYYKQIMKGKKPVASISQYMFKRSDEKKKKVEGEEKKKDFDERKRDTDEQKKKPDDKKKNKKGKKAKEKKTFTSWSD